MWSDDRGCTINIFIVTGPAALLLLPVLCGMISPAWLALPAVASAVKAVGHIGTRKLTRWEMNDMDDLSFPYDEFFGDRTPPLKGISVDIPTHMEEK